MADVNISKYRASVVREGSKPASPGFVVSEGQDPVNPPGTNNFVPYTGATANVELGEFGVEAGFVTLDTTPTNIPTDQGAIYWDEARSTAALIMNGTLQHIGQDSFFYVKNSSGSTIPKGTCVGFAGTDGGSGHILITPFIANGSVPSTYFMGVTSEAIANGAFGQVMHFGELEGINTSGFTAGALLYASSTIAGAFQTTAPVAPNNIILVAAAVNSKNNGAIVVRPTLGSNFGTNESVKLTSVTDKDLLQYTVTAGVGLWENKTLSQVIGSAYVPSTRTLTINGTTQDLSANRTFNVGTVTSVGLSSATSGVTIGSTPVTSSGTITLAIATASGSQNGLLSSTDWTTFNNKVGFSGVGGTTNYLPKFTSSTTISNSQIFDNGTNVGIGTASPSVNLEVSAANTLGSFAKFRLNSPYYNYFEFVNNSGLEINRGGTAYLTISNIGNLLVGTTTDNGARVQVSGSGTFSSRLLVGTSTGVGQDFVSVRFSSADTFSQGLNMVDSNASANSATFQVFRRSDDTYLGNIRRNGTDNAIYVGGNSYLALGANNTEFARITSSGSVGIGTTSPSQALDVYRDSSVASYVVARNGSGVQTAMGVAGDNGSLLGTLSNHNLRIVTNGAVVSTITSGGNLLVGTTTDNGARLQVSGAIYASDELYLDNGKYLRFRRSSGNLSIQTLGIPSGTDDVRLLTTGDFNVLNGSLTNLMTVKNGGNVGIGTNNPSGKLDVRGSFRVTQDATHQMYVVVNSSYAEFQGIREDIAFDKPIVFQRQGGNVLIGTTTDAGFKLRVQNGQTYFVGAGSSSSTYSLIIQDSGNNNQFLVRDDGLISFPKTASLWTTGNAANAWINPSGGDLYRSTSSIKYKKNVKNYDKGLKEVLNLRPVTYQGIGKIDSNKTFAGLIAEEVHELGLSEFVQYAEDGSPDALGYQNMIALLTKAIQELKQEIDTLKN